MSIPKDIVVPPKDVKETIDKTVTYVIKNGKSFEERLLSNNKDNKFDFILDGDPHHAYYSWKLSCETPKEQEVPTSDEDIVVDKPRDLSFLVDLPAISTHDLDIINTTALYIAQNGTDKIPSLLEHEAKLGKRAQFEFLNTSHSLHKLFQTYITQYKKVIDLYKSEQPLPSHTNKFEILTIAYDRAQYISQNKVKEKNQEQLKQQQQIHYASIDWQDFVLVGKIEFDAVDEVQELSVPLTRDELVTRSLESKSREVELPKVAIEVVPEEKEEILDKEEPEPNAAVPGPFKGMKIKAAGASRLKKSSTPKSQEQNIKCPITGKLIPESEFDNHLKSLLRDPRYKQQQENYIRKNFTYASNITTDQVYENIKRLVRKRTSEEPTTTTGKRIQNGK
ncbi:pre-mRNA splicing factor [Spathaspora passalidarum NRRL Y-27907]|uniref:Pre-mRNA splicing factor n=1 Tax=Spathaspora passalidarum (strain NRRL Y-27907 / 11-Y1) TaxID=619300 RepID=G3AT40_SPAPN|nr:pre-mRNA splicing factor [Spathaspora passalidarum NRRL Y-27907]EGW30803.1 pre-mRNA splicing factor [Spathaspora passalidarum NRRL Y-27907]